MSSGDSRRVSGRSSNGAPPAPIKLFTDGSIGLGNRINMGLWAGGTMRQQPRRLPAAYWTGGDRWNGGDTMDKVTSLNNPLLIPSLYLFGT